MHNAQCTIFQITNYKLQITTRGADAPVGGDSDFYGRLQDLAQKSFTIAILKI